MSQTDDLELEKAKAVALLKLRQKSALPVAPATTSPVQQEQPSTPLSFLQKGISQAQSGNPVAGGLNLANSALNIPVQAFGAIDKGLRSIPKIGEFDPGGGLANVLQTPTWLIGKAVQGGQSAIDWATQGLPENVKNLGMSPEHASQAQEAMSNVNQQIAPWLLAEPLAKTVAAIPKIVPENLPVRLEKSAVKVPFKAGKGLGYSNRIAGTLIKENLSPTRAGLDKSQAILDQLDNSSKPARARATSEGKTVDFSELGTKLESLKADLKNDADFTEKSNAIDDMIARANEIGSNYEEGKVPINAAWDFKRSLQNMVGGKYDEVGGYKAEAAKDAARLVLEDITSQVGELRKIGLRQRDLIEAQSTIARRVNQTENTDTFTWRKARAFGAGMAASHYSGGNIPIALGTGLAEYVLDSPSGKHRAAVALDRFRGLSSKPDASAVTLPPIQSFSGGKGEAPTSMGGNMSVKGEATQAQIGKYIEQGKITIKDIDGEKTLFFGDTPVGKLHEYPTLYEKYK